MCCYWYQAEKAGIPLQCFVTDPACLRWTVLTQAGIMELLDCLVVISCKAQRQCPGPEPHGPHTYFVINTLPLGILSIWQLTIMLVVVAQSWLSTKTDSKIKLEMDK